MKSSTKLLIVILALFIDFTVYALYHDGITGFLQVVTGSLVGIQVGLDLCIALGLILAWMVQDARAKGISPAPFIVLTLFTGSMGPLLYLIRRDWKEREVINNRVPANA